MGDISEGRLQEDCFLWSWNELPETRGLICYNLSNSKNKIDGNLNKAKGLQKGRSDLVFYWNKKALMIELKEDIGGVQSKDQSKWQAIVEAQGFEYVICRTLEDFKNTIIGAMK